MKKQIIMMAMAICLLPVQAQEFLTSGPITFTVINEDTKELAVSRIHSDKHIITLQIESEYGFNGKEYQVSAVKSLAIQNTNIENFIFPESIRTFESPLIINSSFGSITLPSEAEVTYPVARSCYGEKLTLPGTCKTPEHILYRSRINQVVIEEGVETIPTTFIDGNDGSSKIRHLYLPSTISFFSADIIRMAGIQELYFKSPEPPRADGTIFVSQFDTMKLYVPEEAVDAYKSDRAWGKFKNILPMGYIPGYNEFGEGPDNAIGEIEADGEDYYIAPEYYTLQGLKVSHPEAGQIYIVRRGAKVTKEVF